MTHRHARYLAQYAERIRRKRLKRRRVKATRVEASRVSVRRLREVLAEHMAMRPAPQPVRAGSRKWHEPISRLFRKPTV